LPSCLEVTAKTWDDEIMGLRHRELRVEGVQFHPESFLTTAGKTLLGNFTRHWRGRVDASRDLAQ
jgi:para-aminobenzoate synthetase component 2